MYNIDPSLWGPHCWGFLFCVSLSYSENPSQDEINNLKNYVVSMGKILPCAKCRNNFGNHIKKYQITETILQSRATFATWLTQIYNEIQVSNNKKICSYEELVDKYVHNKSNYIFNLLTYENINMIIIFVVIIVLILVLKYR